MMIRTSSFRLASKKRQAPGQANRTRTVYLLGALLLAGVMLSGCQEGASPGGSFPLRSETDGLAASQPDLKAQQLQLIKDSINNLDAILDSLFVRYFSDLAKAWSDGHIISSDVHTNLQSKGNDAQNYIAAYDIANATPLLTSLLDDLQAAKGSQVPEPDAGILIGDVQAIIRVLSEQVPGTSTSEPSATVPATATDMPSATPPATDVVITPMPASATPTLSIAPSMTATLGSSCTGTPTIPQLAVWSEPSLQSTQLGLIKPGERYPVYSYVNMGDNTQFQTRFYKIGYRGAFAWALVIYFQVSGDCSAAATPVVPTRVPPTVAPELRSETWTLFSEYVSSDPCSSAATVDVTVPVTLGFDESGTLKVLAWYSISWIMKKAATADGLTYSGTAVVSQTENLSSVDTINLVFTSSQTFEGDMTRIVTSGQQVCKAYTRWHGSR